MEDDDKELAVLVQDIHRLSHELERFERKYGVLSETFYELYSTGEEPDDGSVLDFEKWAGLYEAWRDRLHAYAEALQHLRTERTSLAEIIRSRAA